jgi:pimeloyl-ACP methyl ester carboxylesterase
MTTRADEAQRRFLSAALAGIAVAGVLLMSCGGSEDNDAKAGRPAVASSTSGDLDGVTKIRGGRGLYVRCTGTGSPTVVMEGGDEDTSDSYAFAEPAVGKVTRTCVYDRANLGRSDPAPGPRGLPELVGDLERLLKAARIPGPYVLVGTSGGGYITAGYAYAHPRRIAGLLFVDTGAPLRNPPREIVEATDPDNPANVERRDYLQVERDAWAARKRIGNIPVTILTVKFSAAAIAESPFPSERRAMRRNVQRQRGWLVLSPRAKQLVVNTGHAVEEDDPDLVIDAILDVVRAAR